MTSARRSRIRLGLGTRLALAIGSAVALVILATVVAVSIGVLGRFDAYLTDVRAGRYAEVAALTADVVAESGSLAIKKQELRRLAVIAGGTLIIRDPAGTVAASISELPGIGKGNRAADNATASHVAVPIVVDGVTVGTLEITPLASTQDPSGPAPATFREAAMFILVVAAIAAVMASMLITLVVARRLTRPIGTLAVAARQVEAGDLSVRVPLPSDADSRELAVAFNEMAERLEQSERLRRRAASELAHELGTPITVLVGRLQALADGVVAPDPATLAATRDVAEEVSRLVGDLQDLSAAEGASLRRAAVRADLRTIVGRAGASAQAQFDQAGVVLEVASAADESPVEVNVDERQLERAIANVLTNAATYTPVGGSVAISVAAEGSAAIIRVRDTGPGIESEDLPHIFERFYRGHTRPSHAGDEPGGTGIGLTVARDLVMANGGALVVERTSEAGTTFAIRLARLD